LRFSCTLAWFLPPVRGRPAGHEGYCSADWFGDAPRITATYRKEILSMARRSSRVDELAQVLHILGDKKRLTILGYLREAEEMNVSALVKRMKMPQSTVSHHLALLRLAGLAKTRRDGKEVYYAVDTRPLPSAKALKEVLKGDATMRIGNLVISLV
jgi:DNA-binding transcriptional ArsR family regulator